MFLRGLWGEGLTEGCDEMGIGVGHGGAGEVPRGEGASDLSLCR